MSTTIVKTELGRTIVVQHDNTSPRPYSRRINLLSGSLATFAGHPSLGLAVSADYASPLTRPEGEARQPLLV
jgi:hypothetical protein